MSVFYKFIFQPIIIISIFKQPFTDINCPSKINDPLYIFRQIFEFIFQLKDIANSNTIAFQIYFMEGENAEKHLINLPKRKKELDFKKGQMYYISIEK